MNQVLLIEDEQNVADFIKIGLEEDGYKVFHAKDGFIAFEFLKKSSVSIVLLDILLPNINGLEICKKIRQDGFNELPILMLTALGSAENVVLGLDSGADDYLAKPFKLIELKARIRTLLRRKEYSSNAEPQNTYKFDDINLNDDTKEVSRAGTKVTLTSTEYRLLLMFMKNPLKVLSRTELLDEVWGINFDIGTNVVDVYVNYLRKKLQDKKVIHTVIGMGYVLKSE
ncbi:response regulator transcription factor [uncultured Arcticibacterium sp.]|uniref:response regulator transcription factor n=1 Tax=uncultured Arcticibacterium sp. TaxID=2173042 RepID=UPI0030F7AAD6